MSTLVVATLKSNSSSPPAFQNTSGTEIGRMCRAWVTFNGTGTVAIAGQFNVSSITDNGQGDYTVNFANAMADANYAVSGTSAGRDGVDWCHTLAVRPNDSSGNATLKSASQVRVVSFTNYSPQAGPQDTNNISVLIHR